jgi:hypothetical protein
MQAAGEKQGIVGEAVVEVVVDELAQLGGDILRWSFEGYGHAP